MLQPSLQLPTTANYPSGQLHPVPSPHLQLLRLYYIIRFLNQQLTWYSLLIIHILVEAIINHYLININTPTYIGNYLANLSGSPFAFAQPSLIKPHSPRMSHYTITNYNKLRNARSASSNFTYFLTFGTIQPHHPQYQLYMFINAIYEAQSVTEVDAILCSTFSPYLVYTFPSSTDWSAHIAQDQFTLLTSAYLAANDITPSDTQAPVRYSDPGCQSFLTRLHTRLTDDSHPVKAYLFALIGATSDPPNPPDVDPYLLFSTIQSLCHYSFHRGDARYNTICVLSPDLSPGCTTHQFNSGKLVLTPNHNLPNAFIPTPLDKTMLIPYIRRLAVQVYDIKRSFIMFTYLPFYTNTISPLATNGLLQALSDQLHLPMSSITNTIMLSSQSPLAVLAAILSNPLSPLYFLYIIPFLSNSFRCTINIITPHYTDQRLPVRPHIPTKIITLITEDFYTFIFPTYIIDPSCDSVPLPSHATPRIATNDTSTLYADFPIIPNAQSPDPYE